MSQVDLRAVKASARNQFGDIAGVEGFGLGESSLRIYVRNAEISRALPRQFEGVPVDFVVTGSVEASPASALASDSPTLER